MNNKVIDFAQVLDIKGTADERRKLFDCLPDAKSEISADSGYREKQQFTISDLRFKLEIQSTVLKTAEGLREISDKLREKTEFENEVFVKALTRISKDIRCDGPDCHCCSVDMEHPSTTAAIIAKGALSILESQRKEKPQNKNIVKDYETGETS